MQEITILSGKGGTGKTTITAAIASIAKKAVFCDNDVDAADLHLILTPNILEENSFDSGSKAIIDIDKCTNCDICIDHCRFDSIHYDKDDNIYVNPFECEGCKLCERVCPADAISMIRSLNNYEYVSKTRFGYMVHAKMGAGEENSGRLVTSIRNKSKEIAKENNLDFIINDGPPGIGCPVISSVTGTNKVLLVIEPTKSGFHDIKRLIELLESFKVKTYALINKFDINTEISTEIEEFLKTINVPLLAKIPFDTIIVEAMINKKTINEFAPNSVISEKIKEVWSVLSSTD